MPKKKARNPSGHPKMMALDSPAEGSLTWIVREAGLSIGTTSQMEEEIPVNPVIIVMMDLMMDMMMDLTMDQKDQTKTLKVLAEGHREGIMEAEMS